MSEIKVETCPDQLGVPIKADDKVAYAMSDKSAQMYTGIVLYITKNEYANYSTYSVAILTDKTKREIKRNGKQIIGLQPIIQNHPEYFI